MSDQSIIYAKYEEFGYFSTKQEYFLHSRMIDRRKLQNGDSSLMSYESVNLKLLEDDYAFFNM